MTEQKQSDITGRTSVPLNLLTNEANKMNLIAEYNKNLIAYVVKNNVTGISVNFQFEHDRSIAIEPVGQKHRLASGCEGDATHLSATDDELKAMTEFLKTDPEAIAAEKMVSDIFANPDTIELMKNLQANQGYVNYSDLEELSKKSKWKWAIIDNGMVNLNLVFDYKKEAEEELAAWLDEDAYLAKIIHIDKEELEAIEVILYLGENYKKEILKALNDDAYSESKQYVIEQINNIPFISSVTEGFARGYFWRLISSEYQIGVIASEDGESFDEVKRMTYKKYVIEKVNMLLEYTFDKKVDVRSLLN